MMVMGLRAMVMKNSNFCNNADLEQAIVISQSNVYKKDAIGVLKIQFEGVENEKLQNLINSCQFRSILTGVGNEALGVTVNIDY